MKLKDEYSKTFLSINNEIEEGMFDTVGETLNFDCAIVDVYISSNGGSAFEVDKIIHLLESNFETINIYGTGMLMSGAFKLFFKTKANERKLIGRATGMCHKATWEHLSSLGGDDDAFYEAKKAHLAQLNSDMEIWCREDLKLNKDELDTMFVKGKDQFFSHDRLLEIMKNMKQ